LKIYLAARYSRRDELRKIRDELQSLGNTVTSRWLDGDRTTEDDDKRQVSFDMMKDIDKADCIIVFGDSPELTGRNGAKHVEFGMAIAWGKRQIVVGHRDNLFYHLPAVQFYEDAETMMNDLWRQPK